MFNDQVLRLFREIEEDLETDPTSLRSADAWFSLHKSLVRSDGLYEALWCLVLANASFRDQGAYSRAFDCKVAFDKLRGIDTLEQSSTMHSNDPRRWYIRAALGPPLDVGVRVPRGATRAKEEGAVVVDAKGFLRPGPNPPEFALPAPPPLWPLCEECQPSLEGQPDGDWYLCGYDRRCPRCHGQGYEPEYCYNLDQPLPEEEPPMDFPWVLEDVEEQIADDIRNDIDADVIRELQRITSSA